MSQLSINPTVMRILFTLGIMVLVYGLAALLVFVLGRLSDRFPARRMFFKRLQPIPKIAAYSITGYTLVKVLGTDQSSLFALLGTMALALGLAAQGLLRDIIGGIVVLIDKPFQIGDNIHAAPYYGEVISIGLRSTKLMTPTNQLVTLPNSTLLSQGVSSTTSGTVDCLVTTQIYLPGQTDFAMVEHLTRDAVLTSKMVYIHKPINVLLTNESSGIRMEIRAYVFDSRYEEMLATDLTRRINNALASRDKKPLAITA
jgi:small-conductance mechanosensitive channel